MKLSTANKYSGIVVLLFVGNRIFNHVDAWLGLSLIALALVLALKFIIQSNQPKNDEKD